MDETRSAQRLSRTDSTSGHGRQDVRAALGPASSMALMAVRRYLPRTKTCACESLIWIKALAHDGPATFPLWQSAPRLGTSLLDARTDLELPCIPC
jgi:hypothetical protein